MNYIIGAGTTAWIAKKMLPEYQALSIQASMPPNLFYLWKDKYSEQFIKDTQTKATEIKINIASIGNNIELYNKVTHKNPDNVPCENKKELKGFILHDKMEVDFKKILPIKKVDNNAFTTQDNKLFDYEKAIWTAQLDQTEFFGKKFSVEYFPLTYLNISTEEELFEPDFLYLLEDEYLERECYRVSKKPFGYCFEFARRLSKDLIDTEIFFLKKKLGIKKTMGYSIETNPKGFVTAKEKPSDTNKLFFCGRYAQADYEIKANDVIKKIYEGFK